MSVEEIADDNGGLGCSKKSLEMCFVHSFEVANVLDWEIEKTSNMVESLGQVESQMKATDCSMMNNWLELMGYTLKLSIFVQEDCKLKLKLYLTFFY